MTAQHTPAPWAVVGREIHGQQDSGVIVARIPEWGLLADIPDQGPTNAALIAAAPDLLAALQALLPHVPIPRVPMGQDHADPFPLPDYIKAARTAIAKATGETA